MRSGRVGGMPFAVDDDHSDLALALAQRIAAGVEMGAERRRRLYQLRVMHPDFAWTAGRRGPPTESDSPPAAPASSRHRESPRSGRRSASRAFGGFLPGWLSK